MPSTSFTEPTRTRLHMSLQQNNLHEPATLATISCTADIRQFLHNFLFEGYTYPETSHRAFLPPGLLQALLHKQTMH